MKEMKIFKVLKIALKCSRKLSLILTTGKNFHKKIKAVPPLILVLFAAQPLEASNIELKSPCPFPAGQEVPLDRLVCGYLHVPENREVPTSSLISLPFAIIKTEAREPAHDPVVFLTGGPGASATSSPHTFQLFARHAFGANRDIILLTQRGGFMTEPALTCHELSEARVSIYLEDHTLKERDNAITEVAINCLVQLQESGRDLQSYNAASNAQDLKDLRQALQIEEWNLLGVSYGTYIALEAARIDTVGIRSMILDSPVSMESDLFMSEAQKNFSDGMKRVVNACHSTPSCKQRFPKLGEGLQSLIRSLKEKPITLTLDGKDGAVEMVVNWHDFLNLTHWMLYNAKSLPLIPLLIEATYSGDYRLLTHLMNTVFPAPKNATESAAGTFFAVVCQDQFTERNPIPKPTEPTDFGDFAITSFMEDICESPRLNYGTQPIPEPLKTDVPTLLLSGNFDPMTPSRYAEDIAKNLSHSTLIHIQNYGHSTLSGYTECQTDVAAMFLDSPDEKVNSSCLSVIPDVDFQTSREAVYEKLGLQPC